MSLCSSLSVPHRAPAVASGCGLSAGPRHGRPLCPCSLPCPWLSCSLFYVVTADPPWCPGSPDREAAGTIREGWQLSLGSEARAQGMLGNHADRPRAAPFPRRCRLLVLATHVQGRNEPRLLHCATHTCVSPLSDQGDPSWGEEAALRPACSHQVPSLLWGDTIVLPER